MTVVIVTGTGTGVGKTIATAALAACARGAGIDVAVCKPVQSGAGHDGDGDDDLAEIGRLSGVDELVSVARYPEPLAPAALQQFPQDSLEHLLLTPHPSLRTNPSAAASNAWQLPVGDIAEA